MEEFSGITNPWWKIILNIHKIPAEFPQVKFGVYGLPLVYFSRGELALYERQIDFRSDSIDRIDKLKYKNLRVDFNFEIEYSSIKKIESYLNPKPFMKSFNLSWLRLSLSNNNPFNDLLFSIGGTDIEYIKKTNDTLFTEIKLRTGLQ
jgi:hypothetical protein